jgi:hypothetical protein
VPDHQHGAGGGGVLEEGSDQEEDGESRGCKQVEVGDSDWFSVQYLGPGKVWGN